MQYESEIEVVVSASSSCVSLRFIAGEKKDLGQNSCGALLVEFVDGG